VSQGNFGNGEPAGVGVVVSTGFHKTHVPIAAREAADRGLLRLAITAAYPTRRVVKLLHFFGLDRRGRVGRLFDRDEGIPEARVVALHLPELLYEAVAILSRVPALDRVSAALGDWCGRLYGRLTAAKLKRANESGGIFHFRGSFGHASVERARELGMVTLCDWALPHPSVLDEMVAHMGRLRTDEEGKATAAPDDSLEPWARSALSDLERADAILVNSQFVKDTFLSLGWPAERLHVVYLGVDDNFLRARPEVHRRPTGGRLRLLFAGRLERRKGVGVLVEALDSLGDEVDWELVVAGPVLRDIEVKYGEFLAGPRVKQLGAMSREQLVREMATTPVFVFPTYAEGSARVVFEAMACGCYVITTAQAGSIVEDGIHGALVPSDDPQRLADAIVTADRDRRRVAETGTYNARLIAESYRQVNYGDELISVYRSLLRDRMTAEDFAGGGAGFPDSAAQKVPHP
jgi:glycosyltransferase involved in cell wall biosynthesis